MAEQAQHLVSGVGEVGAGAEDRLATRGAERGIILRRNDPAGDDLDVGAVVFYAILSVGFWRYQSKSKS